MSLNHLIDPLQEPKLDLYVGDVETDNIDVKNEITAENVFVENTITSDAIFASGVIAINDPLGTLYSPLIAGDVWVNVNTNYSSDTYLTNDYVFNSPLYLNGWNSILNVKTFIDTSNQESTFAPYIETYLIRIEGDIDNNAPSVFEFRSREGYNELMDIKCQVRNEDGVGDGAFSSFGCSVLPPDDTLNDFQFRVAPVSTYSTPPLTSNATLTIEIKVLIFPPP